MKKNRLKMMVTGMLAFLPLSLLMAQTSISDEAGLKAISNDLAGSYILTQDITLTEDWTPIGSDAVAFTGMFNGNGKTIKNLTIKQSGSDRIGFFGLAQNATINNLGLENVNVIGQNDVGGVAGRIIGSTIDKCWVAGYVEGNDHVGAILGGSEGDAQSTLSNCYAYAYSCTRSSQVGGIIGTVKNINVTNCYFAGQVVSPSSNSGGIASLIDGGSNNSIESCISMAQNIKGGNTYRILANTGGRAVFLDYNYGYDNSLVNGNTVLTTDGNYGATAIHGENMTMTQLKTVSEYDIMLWDFTNVWKLEAGGYPVFKNQTLPLNLDMIVNLSGTEVIAKGNTVQLSAASIIPGKTVTFTSSDENTATVDAQGVVIAKAAGSVIITAKTQTDGFSYGIEKQCTVEVVDVTGQISTANQLNSIRYALDGDFQLMNDIDLSSIENWVPIQGFTGTLNGNGHVIRNLNINTNSSNVGLFGTVDGVVISNLGIEGANVIGGTSSQNGSDVAVLIGKANDLTLEGCYITDSYVEGRDHVGLLVASTVKRDGVTSIIRNCYSTGRLKNYLAQGAGIIGLAEATTIENCYFSGTIDGSGNVAPIVALAENGDVIIRNCVALSPYVRGGNPSRVLSVKGGNATLTLENNYALYGMKEIQGTDVFISQETDPTLPSGADVQPAQTKDANFYATVLGWDMTNTWKMIAKDGANDSGIYPVLKWQTGQINAHLLGVPTTLTRVSLNSTLEYGVYGSHGQAVTFDSDNKSILNPAETGYNALATGQANAIASSAATSYMNAASKSFAVLVYDPNFVVNISTAEELNNMRNDLTANYRLAADIDLSGYDNFSPIGADNNSPFEGKFYGNGHIIRNLKINRPNDARQGLFGYVKNAYIDELGLEDVNVIGASNAGGLFGYGTGTTVQKVYVTGYVEGVDHVGAIAGGTEGGGNSYVRNCYASAEIKTRASQAGGLLGVAQSTLVENSYFAGTVYAPEGEQGHNSGGIISLNENDKVNLNGVVCLATTITGGTCSEFVARGNALESMTNCFTRSDVMLSAYATGDEGLGQATADQKKDISEFENSTIYKSIGWDFDAVWQIVDGNYPTLRFVTVGIDKTAAAKGVSVYSTNGSVIVKVEKPTTVQIYSLAGTLVYKAKVSDKASISLNKGCYIVKAGETTTKVMN